MLEVTVICGFAIFIKSLNVGRYGGYTNKRRKAIVKLTKDSKDIQLFAEEA